MSALQKENTLYMAKFPIEWDLTLTELIEYKPPHGTPQVSGGGFPPKWASLPNPVTTYAVWHLGKYWLFLHTIPSPRDKLLIPSIIVRAYDWKFYKQDRKTAGVDLVLVDPVPISALTAHFQTVIKNEWSYLFLPGVLIHHDSFDELGETSFGFW